MVSMIKRVVYSALYAVIISFLYERYIAFAPLWANRPGKLIEVQQHVGETRTILRNGVRNCEDALLLEDSGFAILSCDEGRDRWNTVMGVFRTDLHIPSGKLYLYDYTQQDSPESSLRTIALEKFEHADDFHPLGIEYDGATSTLYVVSHAASGSCIEIFTIDLASATATHVRTFKHDLIHTPNSIHSIGNGRLYVTNDHYFRAAASLILSKIESFSGLTGGTVTYVDVNDPQSARVVARVPFANGITMLNSTTIAVGSPSKPGVFFFEVEADHSLLYKSVVRAPASVDNLSVDSSGVLLVAGHPDPFRLEHVTKSRFACVPGSEDEKERRACECDAPSWAAEWTEEGGLQTFYQGMGFCSSTTFVRDAKRRVGLVTGLYEAGILEFRA